MEIINELEPNRRHVYCGALGYIDFSRKMATNIAIRTVLVKDDHAYYWAGGGIVIDSKWQDEYQESFDKASDMFDMMGQNMEIKGTGTVSGNEMEGKLSNAMTGEAEFTGKKEE